MSTFGNSADIFAPCSQSSLVKRPGRARVSLPLLTERHPRAKSFSVYASCVSRIFGLRFARCGIS